MSFETTQPPVKEGLFPGGKRVLKSRRERRVWKRLQSFRLAKDLLRDPFFLIGCNSSDLASLSLTPPGHDSLTGLPDRRLFFIRLDRAFDRALRQENYAFAVLFIDLDRFKNINDTFGHMAGDHVLCEVAWRLVECIRPGDMVARHGGDEFTVFIDRIEDEGTALSVARRIADRFKVPVTFEGREASIAGSIGIAFSWHNYTRPEAMLNDADCAMYRAKAKGKSGYEVIYRRAAKFPNKPR